MAVKYRIWITGISLILLAASCTQKKENRSDTDGFSGSGSCIECHERFYELWAPSFHGKAMQPVNKDFIQEYSLPPSEPMELEGKIYQVTSKDSSMIMYESENGNLINKYELTWSLGGRNVFCFLVPLDKGRLQTIPLAYDMNRKTWFNYPQSAVRHFLEDQYDEPLPWKDRMYTFNTGCYNCHVSQLTSNFDLATETYQTTWREAGINCETCHGPSAEHVRVCREAAEGEVPEDLKIIITSEFTPQQQNASCAPCHAKVTPITAGYTPGDRFFDNFNISTLEDPDFYPDGRDLGENYTYTGWLMNPCLKSGDIHCVTCHTSSGRNRFSDNPNQACTMCHTDRAESLAEHTMHEPGTPGSECVSCHAPTREFVGRFLRSDHSFRPPMPAATIKLGSPNACNICHNDKSPEWADQIVRKRENSNYQEETLYWAQLIKEARKEDWNRVDEMLEIIGQNTFDEVVTTSFIRLLANYPDDKKWKTIINALKENSSPLVRSAAANTLAAGNSETARKALLSGAKDDFRLVRISAAASLAAYDPVRFTPQETIIKEKATKEYMNSLITRPDDWSAHYNKGIFHQNRGEAPEALESYETAARLYPASLLPLINSSVLYSYTGNQAKAEENLKKVLDMDPVNEAANLNLGLLLAEQGRMEEAEKTLLAALTTNPQQAVAAYNLSVIYSQKSMDEAVKYAAIAAEAAPDDPKYAYTLAYYQFQNNQKEKAKNILKQIVDKHPGYLYAVSLLADILVKEDKIKEAVKLYNTALNADGISENDRRALRQALNSINKFD
jgi:tetratricopeptide (TPR) repeat protein